MHTTVKGIPLFAKSKYENFTPFLSATSAIMRLLAAPSNVKAPAKVLEAAKSVQYNALEEPAGIRDLKRGSKRAVRGTLLKTCLRIKLLKTIKVVRFPLLRKFRVGYIADIRPAEYRPLVNTNKPANITRILHSVLAKISLLLFANINKKTAPTNEASESVKPSDIPAS